jgi:hypothetical protein
VSFGATASDNCGTQTVTAVPSSGATFPVGTNTVNVTATDSSGNQSTCSFQVVVSAGAAPLLSVSPAGTNTVIAWPSAAFCYTLQWTPAALAAPISNTIWNIYPGPFFTIGTNSIVTNASSGTHIFRLRY